MPTSPPEFYGLLVSIDGTAINAEKYPTLAAIIRDGWDSDDAFLAEIQQAGEERRAKEKALRAAYQTVFANLPADFDMNATGPKEGPQRPTQALFGAVDQSHP